MEVSKTYLREMIEAGTKICAQGCFSQCCLQQKYRNGVNSQQQTNDLTNYDQQNIQHIKLSRILGLM